MKNRTIKITYIFILLISAVFICGCRKSHPRTIYRLACEAVRSHTNFPPSAQILPMKEARIQICKNISRVDVPCKYRTSEGEKTLVFTVWLKDYAHSWVVDRCYQAQFYTNTEDSSTNQTSVTSPPPVFSGGVSNTPHGG